MKVFKIKGERTTVVVLSEDKDAAIDAADIQEMGMPEIEILDIKFEDLRFEADEDGLIQELEYLCPITGAYYPLKDGTKYGLTKADLKE